MARVFTGKARLFAPVERALYRAAGVTGQGQRWTGYAAAVLSFNAAGFLLLYLILRLQGFLPFNPQGFGAMEAGQAFNTAVSFMTNTNWQSYGGETTVTVASCGAVNAMHDSLTALGGMIPVLAIAGGMAAKPRAPATAGTFPTHGAAFTLLLVVTILIVGALTFLSWPLARSPSMSRSRPDWRS